MSREPEDVLVECISFGIEKQLGYPSDAIEKIEHPKGVYLRFANGSEYQITVEKTKERN